MICVAHLIKHKSDDGLMEMNAGVPLGKMYLVDTDTVRECDFFNTECGKTHTKVMVNVVDEDGKLLGILPCELLLPVYEERSPTA